MVYAPDRQFCTLSSSIPGIPTGEDSSSVSDTEADEMEEHLRGLGYLE